MRPWKENWTIKIVFFKNKFAEGGMCWWGWSASARCCFCGRFACRTSRGFIRHSAKPSGYSLLVRDLLFCFSLCKALFFTTLLRFCSTVWCRGTLCDTAGLFTSLPRSSRSIPDRRSGHCPAATVYSRLYVEQRDLLPAPHHRPTRHPLHRHGPSSKRRVDLSNLNHSVFLSKQIHHYSLLLCLFFDRSPVFPPFCPYFFHSSILALCLSTFDSNLFYDLVNFFP